MKGGEKTYANFLLGKRTLCFFTLLIAFLTLSGQISISGYVYNSENEETLAGVQVYIMGTQEGTTTTDSGYFDIAVDNVAFVYVIAKAAGFTSDTVKVILPQAQTLSLRLRPGIRQLNPVIITAKSGWVEQTIGRLNIPIEHLSRVPALGGEPDVMRAIQLLPGIQGGNEASSGLHVRGGSPDQTLILLDGVPVYNPSHIMGVLSIFDTEAVEEINLYKGGFPARYGGRLSSVLDVSLREGNTQNIKGSATIGLLASRIFLEGPIIKERTSFLISLRRSFWDFFANPIQRISQNPEVLSYNFFDVTLKINHQLNPTNVISASFYTGKDRFSTQVDESVTIDNQNFRLEEKYTLGWGNRIAMLRWTSGKANPWLSKLTLYNTIYRFDISDQLRQNSNGTIRKFFLSFQSDIQNWTIAEDLQFSITHNHTLRLGANAGMYLFTPGAFILEQDNDSTATEDRNASGFRIQTYEWNTYLEDELGLGKKIQINAGLRLNGFISGDKQVIIPQPRVSVNFDINAKTSLRGSFSRMGQFIHVLSNSTVSMPLDLWVPSTPNIGPQSGWELSAGIFRNESKYWELTLEAYYKQLKGMVEYQEGANMFMDGVSTQLANTPLWEQKVVTGKGWSYGIEGLLRKKEGRFDGWLSYSLAWHRRQFTLLNNGEPFPYKYDRRHDFDLVFHYLWKPNISFDLTWSYQSGQTGNLPVGGYAAHPWIDGFAFDDFIVFYGSRNSYRFKPYHRLDVGITLKKSRWGGTQSWKLGVYNLYNRANPFAVSVYGRPGTASVIESSLFPILPIVSYQWAF